MCLFTSGLTLEIIAKDSKIHAEDDTVCDKPLKPDILPLPLLSARTTCIRKSLIFSKKVIESEFASCVVMNESALTKPVGQYAGTLQFER